MKFIIQDDWERDKKRASFLYIHKGSQGTDYWWVRNKAQATVFDSKHDCQVLGKTHILIIPAPTPSKTKK